MAATAPFLDASVIPGAQASLERADGAALLGSGPQTPVVRSRIAEAEVPRPWDVAGIQKADAVDGHNLLVAGALAASHTYAPGVHGQSGLKARTLCHQVLETGQSVLRPELTQAVVFGRLRP